MQNASRLAQQSRKKALSVALSTTVDGEMMTLLQAGDAALEHGKYGEATARFSELIMRALTHGSDVPKPPTPRQAAPRHVSPRVAASSTCSSLAGCCAACGADAPAGPAWVGCLNCRSVNYSTMQSPNLSEEGEEEDGTSHAPG